jgi:hypothetical protein
MELRDADVRQNGGVVELDVCEEAVVAEGEDAR